jgi:hypothetical protein
MEVENIQAPQIEKQKILYFIKNAETGEFTEVESPEGATHRGVKFQTKSGNPVIFKASLVRKTAQEKKERMEKKVIERYEKQKRKAAKEAKGQPPKKRARKNEDVAMSNSDSKSEQ